MRSKNKKSPKKEFSELTKVETGLGLVEVRVIYQFNDLYDACIGVSAFDTILTWDEEDKLKDYYKTLTL